MTYIVYADVMFGYQLLINLAVYFMLSILLQQTIKYKRILLWSVLSAILSTGIYILTVHVNTLLYTILYVISYLIMTYIYSKNKTFSYHFAIWIFLMFLCSLILYGVLSLFPKNTLFGCILSILVCWGLSVYMCLHNIKKEMIYEIEIQFRNKRIRTLGFLDTGNTLCNPYNKQAVILMDYRLFKRMLSPDSFVYVEQYHQTGMFPYSEIYQIEGINCFPLPYHTVSTKEGLLPAFILPGLYFCKSGKKYENVTVGVSRETFMNGRYSILLNNGLKPD